MKILNLYCGIGGNRKLWGSEHEVTAVEFDPKIAAIYKDLYPNDTVIIGDAHQYLLDHYNEFDFIWGSPPCPTHSITNFFLNKKGIIRYPAMELYQEVIFLTHFFKGKWVIENVKSYYNPLITPQVSGRHYFWSNFIIPELPERIKIGRMNGCSAEMGKTQNQLRMETFELFGFDLSKYKFPNKEKLLRNCVDPEIGLTILQSATNIYKQKEVKQVGLFANAVSF